MEKCCKICKLSNDNDAGAHLFQAPQEEKKRKAWSKACGVFLTKKCLICQDHFDPSDFIGRKSGIRLKPNALPIHDLSQDPVSRTENVVEDTPISTTIKAEPPELVLVNPTEPKEQTTELNAFLDVNVKVEVSEAVEPLVLIHEARFDEENSNAAVNVLEEKKKKAMENSVEIESPQKNICGNVEVIDDNGHDVFKLKCNYCDVEYQMSYWPYFIDHVKAAHRKTEQVKTPETEAPKSITSDVDEKVQDEQEDSIACEAEGNQSDSSSDSKEVDEEKDTDSDTEYEPKNKKLRKERKVVKRQNNESHKRTIKENLVFFDHSEGQCVIDYLELLKLNPILWHRRQSIMKRFDEAIAKITAEFNTKWPKYQMTYEQSRTSINRIKDLYQRVSDSTHKRHIKNSMHLKKYPKYFELCAEIEENSKTVTNPCDHCRAFFFNEIDLQVHKVKQHRIGELPFKCSRCKYGFSKAEKLAEHEQKHHRSKTFTCEVCNKGFFEESKLLAHEAIHTNDYKPVCEVCGEIFTTQSKYRRHRLHHEPPKEKCEICGKLYYEKWNLSEHVKSHRNERLYQCDICGKSFNHRNDVTIHKRGVHNVKPQPQKYVWVNKNSFNYNDDVHDFI